MRLSPERQEDRGLYSLTHLLRERSRQEFLNVHSLQFVVNSLDSFFIQNETSLADPGSHTEYEENLPGLNSDEKLLRGDRLLPIALN